MAEKITELRKDVAELEELEARATRAKVKTIVSLEIRKLNSEISKLQEQLSVSAPTVASATPKRYQSKINNYAWDQSSKFVKFYVTLPGVHTISEDKIACDFTNKSLELTVTDLENKDYVFTINNLLAPINPEGSNWKIKSDMIVINAAKVKGDQWSHITEFEKKASDAKANKFKTDDKMDPNEGLMSMMKNMYDSGDDEMKRTIAKAWTESQNKI